MRTTDPTSGEAIIRKHLQRFDDIVGPRELTFSCFRGYQFFSSDKTRQWFVDELSAARTQWRLQLYAYVIMPEHVHLLVYSSEVATEIGRIVGKIKERVARRAIRFLTENDPSWLERITVEQGGRARRRFWQAGGGFDRNVLETSTLRKMIDYIHANPIRRGLVHCADDWKWSSAGWYAGVRPVPIEMDDLDCLVLDPGADAFRHRRPQSTST